MISWVESQVLKMNDDWPPSSQWQYKLWLPDWLAVWDVFAAWEKERFLSMEGHLKKGDILFDIGTEVGWCNIIYAKFCGAKNMVLIEPVPDFWPNIKETWKKNYPRTKPLACYEGFFSDKTTKRKVLDKHEWPESSTGLCWLEHSMPYRYLHEHGHLFPQIKLDYYVKKTGIIPDALTMDVEGACVLVIKGALETLKKYHPKVWISVHPEIMERNYPDNTPEELFSIMEGLGYKKELLAIDHEHHYYFA